MFSGLTDEPKVELQILPTGDHACQILFSHDKMSKVGLAVVRGHFRIQWAEVSFPFGVFNIDDNATVADYNSFIGAIDSAIDTMVGNMNSIGITQS